MPSASDVYITPADKKIDFYDSSAVKGKLYYQGGYFKMYSAADPIGFEGYNGLHYFIASSKNNRIFLYNYADGTGYGTYAANYLQLRDGSSNIEAYLVAGNGSFVSGNLAIGTNSAGEKLHVVGTGRFTGKVAFGGSTLPTNTGISVVDTIQLSEKGSSPTATTAWGTVWVSGSTPNKLYFTDDAGTAHDLTAGGGGTIAGSLSDNYIPIGSAANTVSNFVLGLTEDDSIYIGTDPSSTTNSAGNNVALGIGALDDITTADDNTAIGYKSLYTLNSGIDNVAVGTKSGYGVTTGGQNVLVGKQAGESVGTHSHNTYAGYNAAIYHSGDNNVGIGSNVMRTGSNDYNVAVGMSAMTKVSGGAGGVAIGFQSGYHPTGNYNTWVGYNAGFGAAGASAEQNVGVGREVMMNVSSGDKNTALGYQAGKGLTTAEGNTFVGHIAGFGEDTGSYNTVVGYKAYTGSSGGTENVAIGVEAMRDNTSGDYNTALGTNALYKNTTTSANVAIGRRSMFTSTTAEQNVAVGYHTLYDLTEGDKNVAIGHSALSGATTAHSSIAIGYQALDSTTKGSENVAIGAYAGQAYVGTTSSVYGGLSVFVGHTAGYQLTGNASYGSVCVLGHAAAYSATGANLITAVGNSAMYYADGAKYNTAVGRVAGAYAKGTGSTHVGDSSGYRVSGNYNTSVGYTALSGGSSGTGFGTATQNVAIGREAMLDATSAQENVVIGNYAAAEITAGNYNTAIGYGALRYGTTTNRQVAIGYAALSKFTQSGDLRNTAVGMYAMLNPRSGSNNIAMGYGAMQGDNSVYDSDYNVALGSDTLFALQGGDNNTAVGYQAGKGVTTGGDNVLVGYQAGSAQSTATAATLVGYKAGNSNTANSTVALGKNAGFSNSSGGNNTFVGFSAGHSNSTGASNVFLGYQAGYPMNANNNVVIGTNAGVAATSTTNDSVLIGNEAGYSTAGNQIAIGRQALYFPEGNYNVAIGQEAMHGVSATVTAEQNVAIGRQALFSATSAGSNVVVGYAAGYNQTTADDNVFIGASAGKANTTAAGNVAIGKDAMKIGAQTSSDGGQNTVVGYGGYVDGTGLRNVVLGYRAAYTATSANSNVNIGYEAGQKNTTGDSNVFIGNKAGPSSTSTDSNKLYINNNEGTPLIGGDFSAGEVTINASSKSITLDPYFVVSGDNQYSMISGSEGLALYGGNSYTDIWIDGQNSRQLRLRSVASDGSFDAGSFLEVFPSSVGATGDAVANIRASSGDLALYSVGSNDIIIDSHDTLALRFDNEYTMYSAADGNARFHIRAASVAGMEFDGSSKIAFKNAATTKMTLDTANGRLGIGTTAPAYKLDVFGDARVKGLASNTTVELRGDTGYGASIKYVRNDGSYGFHVGMVENASRLDITANNSSTEKIMSFTSDKEVGIGTTSPASYSDKFSIKGTSTNGWPLGITNSDDSVKGAFRTDATDNYFAMATKTASDIRFFYNDAEANTALIIKGAGATAGNVGIGTTAPAQKLHVEGGFRFRDGNSSSQRLEGYGQNDNFMLVVSGSDALGLAGGTPGVRFNDVGANTHLTVKPRADGAGGTTSALLSGANNAGLYFATESGTRLELTGNHIIKTGQTIDNMVSYSTAAVHTATTATQVYQIEAQATQTGDHTTTLNLPNGNVGGERFTVTCIAIGNDRLGSPQTGKVLIGGVFINGTNLLSPTVTSITGATAAGTSVMQVKTFEFTWVASQFNPSNIGGWVYTVNTM